MSLKNVKRVASGNAVVVAFMFNVVPPILVVVEVILVVVPPIFLVVAFKLVVVPVIVVVVAFKLVVVPAIVDVPAVKVSVPVFVVVPPVAVMLEVSMDGSLVFVKKSNPALVFAPPNFMATKGA